MAIGQLLKWLVMTMAATVVIVGNGAVGQAATMHGHVHADMYAPEHDTSSEAMRHKQAVQLMVGSYGYAIGLLVSEDRSVELGHSGLRIHRNEEGVENEELDRWSQTLFAHTRFFHGNSFNTSWGVSWEDSGFGTDPFQRSERSKAFFDAALGNQWTWRHFVLGVDWIGMSVPFFERVRVKEDGSETDQGRERRFAMREWHGVDWKALQLHVGVVF